jgi:hypothetical protein
MKWKVFNLERSEKTVSKVEWVLGYAHYWYDGHIKYKDRDATMRGDVRRNEKLFSEQYSNL